MIANLFTLLLLRNMFYIFVLAFFLYNFMSVNSFDKLDWLQRVN